MRAVDTNVLVRLIVRDDKAQQTSAESFVAKGAWVSHLVLAETVWVLDSVYGLDRSNLIDAIEMLLSQAVIIFEEPHVVSAALEHYKKKNSIGFTDCLILEIARKAGHIPLGTFDKNLSKIGGTQKL
ncbi:MAG: PIN domain-containing protein [Pyrinomonadaceae bacterium]